MIEAGYIGKKEMLSAYVDADFVGDDGEVYKKLIENRKRELRDLGILLNGSFVAYLNGHVLSEDDCKRILSAAHTIFPEYVNEKKN